MLKETPTWVCFLLSILDLIWDRSYIEGHSYLGMLKEIPTWVRCLSPILNFREGGVGWGIMFRLKVLFDGVLQVLKD